MDWNGEITFLKSLIAVLYSLSRRAQCAAGRSYAVRCWVLWILRRAERHAWRCLDLEPPPFAFFCNSRADALDLAKNFRIVARALEKELRALRRYVRRCVNGSDAGESEEEAHPPAPLSGAGAMPVPPAVTGAFAPLFDTS